MRTLDQVARRLAVLSLLHDGVLLTMRLYAPNPDPMNRFLKALQLLILLHQVSPLAYILPILISIAREDVTTAVS